MNFIDTSGALAPRQQFEFEGNWREFLPIAATNLLLSVVTLGFYRFWATARERRYLWGRTRFLGEHLEWAGTGKEMFVGFLVAMALFLPLFLFLNFGVQALILRDEAMLATVGGLASVIALFYLIGVARFRAVRYRLSRTYWRGIRGGSDEPGWRYGLSHLGRSAAAFLSIGLLVPWSMATLWRQRWGAMSFGPYSIRVGNGPATQGLKRRWLLIYLFPLALLGLSAVASTLLVLAAVLLNIEVPQPDQISSGTIMAVSLAAVLIMYGVMPLLFLPYWSAFYGKMVGEMSLSGLQFAFTARTKDWIRLILGHIGLVLVTLGFGLMFIGYRNWAFFARHLEVTGDLDLATLTQSATALRSDAEGLADAFDVGAI